jgi:selenocysteine-specific elongation factor
VRVRGLQFHGEPQDSMPPGNRVALNLAGIDHDQIGRGDAVVIAEQWRPTLRFDARLHVLASLRHDVGRRGAYLAYIGSREAPVRVRVLGAERIPPGQTGLVRLHLTQAVPLVLGDRFILRESGRDETVGGGEVLDVDPVLPASKADPDGSVERIIAERGWVAVEDLEALTGERRPPTVGNWVLAPTWMERTREQLRERIAAAALGLDLAELDERERAIAPLIHGVTVESGRARLAAATDPLVDHPFIETLRRGGVVPPDPTGVDRAELRELVRRKLIVERDGIFFHPSAIDLAAAGAAALLGEHPEGFTVADLRDRLGVTRKYALPLVNELDARAITRRRGDLRVAGPRLPGAAGSEPA